MTFSRDSRSRLFSVFGGGHVELPEASSDEYSLVCAAVSSILQATRLGLEEYAKVPLEIEQRKGDLRMSVPEDRRDDAAVQAILGTAELSIEQLSKQYPQHVALERHAHT
ncbi:MAG: ribosomal-processing cysteine protease Prp [Candidatus Eremiobacteraeota bacterium]|nr:ribosomal-processing cysteine protease Prp [Candidatus Eremiobacteraeota bacterium]